MGRPSKTDRGSLVEAVLTIRLTMEEKALLERLVATRAEAHRMQGVTVTMTSVVRGLIAKAVEEEEGTPTLKAEAPAASKVQQDPLPLPIDVWILDAQVEATIQALAPKHRRVIPLPILRRQFPGVERKALDGSLHRLESSGKVDLKIANDPTTVDREGGIESPRGLLFYVIPA